MKTRISIIVLLSFVFVGCAGMKKPDLNKIFNVSQKSASNNVTVESKEASVSSKKSTSSSPSSSQNPLMKLDEWIRKNMW